MGELDLIDLQFISCDSVFDRYSFNPDKFEIFKMFLKSKFNDFNSELGYYQLNGTSIIIPELGFMFSDDHVKMMVKETLKRLLTINIKRKGAYAQVKSMKIKLVSNPVLDTIDNNTNWIEIKSAVDIDNLQFDINDFFTSVNSEDAVKQREDIEKRLKELAEREAQMKASKKNSKKEVENE